jgi:HK97 family phage major capsid protein
MTTRIQNMTRAEAISRMHTVQSSMEILGDRPRLDARDDAAFNALGTEFDDLTEHVERLDRAGELAGAGSGRGRFRVDRGMHGEDDRGRGDGVRSDALRTLDAAVRDDRLGARGAELVEDLMRTGSTLSQTWTQRYAAAAGAPAYERAFAKLVANPTQGHLEWTPEEGDAYRRVAEVQGEQRAMSTTDAAGGYMIPLTLDPAVLLTSAGSINPLRQICRVVQTVTDTWQGVTSAGVTAEWTAEAAEVADASPTLGSPSIPVYKGDAFVPFSFEVQGDAINFMGELSKLLMDGAEQLNATAYTTGSGTGQPKGIITSLVGSAGTVPLITPATPETFVAGDVYTVQNALPPRFQPNASWNAALPIINFLRQAETTNGALKFPALQDNPPMLLGRTMYENSNMDGTFDAAATANNYLLLYGSFADGMVIVDRIGSSLELVPHIFGSNRRPTGQRGALLWFRTGSDVVIPNAFRLLNIATTA